MWELLFPPVCVWCGQDVPRSSDCPGPFCSECEQQLSQCEPPARCPWCEARRPPGAERRRCRTCRGWPGWFGPVFSAGSYEGLLRRCVLRGKTLPGEFLCAALARRFARNRRAQLARLDFHWIVPVPMHWSRRWRRGTNPAETIAWHLASALGVRCGKLLRRVRPTPRQSHLPASQRRRNVQGAFRPRRGVHLQGARVLLVDDIMATGSTALNAARALRASGAVSVTVAVLARAQDPGLRIAARFSQRENLPAAPDPGKLSTHSVPKTGDE